MQNYRNEIVVEERSLLQSRAPDVQSYAAGDSAETLTLYWNEIGKWLLRDFLGYDPRRKDRSSVGRMIRSTAGQTARLATVVHFPVATEKHGGGRQIQ